MIELSVKEGLTAPEAVREVCAGDVRLHACYRIKDRVGVGRGDARLCTSIGSYEAFRACRPCCAAEMQMGAKNCEGCVHYCKLIQMLLEVIE